MKYFSYGKYILHNGQLTEWTCSDPLDSSGWNGLFPSHKTQIYQSFVSLLVYHVNHLNLQVSDENLTSATGLNQVTLLDCTT